MSSVQQGFPACTFPFHLSPPRVPLVPADTVHAQPGIIPASIHLRFSGPSLFCFVPHTALTESQATRDNSSLGRRIYQAQQKTKPAGNTNSLPSLYSHHNQIPVFGLSSGLQAPAVRATRRPTGISQESISSVRDPLHKEII